jgi:hypothetical protein
VVAKAVCMASTVRGNVKAGKYRAVAIAGDPAFAAPTVLLCTQAGLPGVDIGL